MEKFIKLEEESRKLFFKKLKEKIGITWDKFYPKYNISRTMFFNYLSGRYFLPSYLFFNWKKLANIDLKFTKIKRLKSKKNTFKKIRLTNNLSEIIGVLNGDGHISKYKYEVCIVCDSKERGYLNYLKKLLEKTLKIEFKFIRQKSKTKLRTYSRDLSNFLTISFNLPKGKKKGNLKIPKEIKKSNNFSKSYVRGLFDTDGTIYLRRKNSPVIEISSGDPIFLKEIYNLIKKLGFNPSLHKNYLALYQKKEIRKFFQQIKPKNPKHLNKCQKWLN